MCCLLVSGFLTEITQQIHSLRASGVMSSHFASAAGSEVRTFRKSAGTVCTAPWEIDFVVMDFSLHPTVVALARIVGSLPLQTTMEDLLITRDSRGDWVTPRVERVGEAVN
jgi:hypothetical protein